MRHRFLAAVLCGVAFASEVLMQVSPAAYQKALPDAGPMLTSVEPNHDRYPPVPPG